MDFTLFKKDLDELGIILTDLQFQQFQKYYELLVEWNSFMNLTGITEWDEVCKKHFIDSLSIVKAFDISKVENVIDITDQKNIKNNLTFVNWGNNRRSPETLTKNDFEKLKKINNKYFFARKFDIDEDVEIIIKLDELIK